MPITHYSLQGRVFFAKESGDISDEEARQWADKLKESAASAPTPIIALVDAMDVKHISLPAINIFARASFTHNVLGIVVATNLMGSGTSRNIGLLGKRNHTVVFRTLDEARQHAFNLVGQQGEES